MTSILNDSSQATVSAGFTIAAGLDPHGAISGEASLDSAAIQSTKSEIRMLAAEIAQLSQAALEASEFFEGFLPRLCAAMGAKAAAVWKFSEASSIFLVAEHAFPAELVCVREQPWRADDQSLDEPRVPSAPHRNVLACVAAESQPVLVPPGNTELEAERPTNPLADALIIVPVRLQDRVEYLLEVVQRPTGGPAAQRGYLRFVAQMADLMADFLRRDQLRDLSRQQSRLREIERWLVAIASAENSKLRQRTAADALAELLDAERALLLDPHTSRLLAISHTATFDERSETVVAARRLQRRLADATRTQVAMQSAKRSEGPTVNSNANANEHFAAPEQDNLVGQGAWQWFDASERRLADAAAADTRPSNHDCVDELCLALGCRSLLVVPVGETAMGILAFAESVTARRSTVSGPQDQQLVESIGRLLAPEKAWRFWPLMAPPSRLRRESRSSEFLHLVQLWASRIALSGLLAAVACFPVPQHIVASAILQPTRKEVYFAPADGIVVAVPIDEGDEVAAEQLLLRLSSRELDTIAENLANELKKIQTQIAEKSSLLNRGESLSLLDKDQLEFSLRELEATARSIEGQLQNNAEQRDELNIVARQSGQVATWDAKNQLLNHPVVAGQPLVSTFDADGEWHLQLSIPDYRAGLVDEAMRRSSSGAIAVHFSLASHPDHLLTAYAANLAPQVSVQPSLSQSAMTRVVRTKALIEDASALPIRKEGAVARATVDCGRVPFVWLVVRDAYWAVSSRFKMLW